jgi:hypothetical protein
MHALLACAAGAAAPVEEPAVGGIAIQAAELQCVARAMLGLLLFQECDALANLKWTERRGKRRKSSLLRISCSQFLLRISCSEPIVIIL